MNILTSSFLVIFPVRATFINYLPYRSDQTTHESTTPLRMSLQNEKCIQFKLLTAQNSTLFCQKNSKISIDSTWNLSFQHNQDLQIFHLPELSVPKWHSLCVSENYQQVIVNSKAYVFGTIETDLVNLGSNSDGKNSIHGYIKSNSYLSNEKVRCRSK